MSRRTWTDEQLRAAVASQRSWRGVLRALGLNERSGGSIKVVKRRAEFLELETDHFSGHRRWSDQELIAAVEASDSWEEVAERLGLVRDLRTGLRMKGHAVRLGIDASYLDDPTPTRHPLSDLSRDPQGSSLRHAAPLIVASWFSVRGFPVSLPSEPQAYDLLVSTPEGIQRVQVKSSTNSVSNGSWHVGIGRRPYSMEKSSGKIPYDPDDLDIFAVVDGNGGIYVIPIEAVAGLTAIYLSAYEEYLVGNVAGLLN